MTDLFNYKRRETHLVKVGNVSIGSDAPIAVQSMTTTDTNDTQSSVEQAIRIIQAGGKLVRLTTQGNKEAENLKNIRQALDREGYETPIVADVHFNAQVAETAAHHAQKVRINPGNYVDPVKRFKQIEYTADEYRQETNKIRDRLIPLIELCKKRKTALRIGVNHGSLSDRIMSRYGDTVKGIVESCMEFLRICVKEDFSDVIISIKASNTVVMVTAVRALVETMERENMSFPLHLGVTEAGEGEDGRIKSAVGIGALLADGIGDTIRVSLSEAPENEIPVAQKLVDYISARKAHMHIPCTPYPAFSYTQPTRRKTIATANIGGDHVPVVIISAQGGEHTTESFHQDMTPDYIYTGGTLPKSSDTVQKYIVDYNLCLQMLRDGRPIPENIYPIFPYTAMPLMGSIPEKSKFLVLQYGVALEEYAACLRKHPEVVVVCMTNHANKTGDQRALVHEMMNAGLQPPVIFAQMYQCDHTQQEDLQIQAAADMGALMIDGLTDGIWLMNNGDISSRALSETAFAILQAARIRTSKTEYISCPGCGRTLYHLPETIARIKAATKDMKGLKIGIMGCIVNGPGEMADADYGYVGAGPGKISLYRKQVCVQKNIPESQAVESLLALMAEDQRKEQQG